MVGVVTQLICYPPGHSCLQLSVYGGRGDTAYLPVSWGLTPDLTDLTLDWDWVGLNLPVNSLPNFSLIPRSVERVWWAWRHSSSASLLG